jgi:phage shock protein C
MNASIKKLYRTRSDAQLAGICSGLGRYMAVDPNVVRLVALIATIATGLVPGILAYLGAWLIVPSEPVQRVVRVDPAAQAHQPPSS